VSAVALDSSAVITWILKERGWQGVDAVMKKADPPYLPGAALAEVIYRARARGNKGSPAQIVATLEAQGFIVEPPTTADLVRGAELYELSATHPGPVNTRTGQPITLSLGDALILAVTERLGCPVLTRDGLWPWFANAGHTSVRVISF
jgi:PIN domain nuclease of toxin-antitoxin system